MVVLDSIDTGELVSTCHVGAMVVVSDFRRRLYRNEYVFIVLFIHDQSTWIKVT